MMKFTLLMCIYVKENPLHLAECIESIKGQSVKPDEILIIKDGPLTADLEAVLDKAKENDSSDWTIIQLPENVTLGPARAKGVEAAKYEWIAIMDTDDICRPDRFKKQIEMIEGNSELGLLGGQIEEFFDDEQYFVTAKQPTIRAVPTGHCDIIRYAKLRSPFNHMTVMFKREAVLKAGNYRLFPWLEDYDLWTRMINDGTMCANHPDVLVDARTDSSMFERRRGAAYIRSEWRMQKQLRKLGFINNAEFMRNTALRVPVRLLPGAVLQKLYRSVLR